MMRIIPAIDLLGGRCVRLTKGAFESERSYSEDPLSVACAYEEAGARYLHLVDLDGARTGHPQHFPVLRQISRHTKLTVDFGGGVKTRADIDEAFACGAARVSVGTIAVREPGTFRAWLNDLGPDKLILSADVLDGAVRVAGWRDKGGLSVDDLLHTFRDSGLLWVACTDIAQDGTLGGFNIDLYQKLCLDYPALRVIASGGAGSVDDLNRLAGTAVWGVIVGKAFYEGRIPLSVLGGSRC